MTARGVREGRHRRGSAASETSAWFLTELADPSVNISRWEFTVRDTQAKTHDIGVRIRRDVLEVWHGGRCQAVIDRRMFRRWLDGPQDWLLSDDVLLVSGPGYVALGIRGALSLTGLGAEVVTRFREQV